MGFLIVANAEERYLCFVDSMIPHRSTTKVNQSETALTLFWRGPGPPYIGREAKSPLGLTLPFSVWQQGNLVGMYKVKDLSKQPKKLVMS